MVFRRTAAAFLLALSTLLVAACDRQPGVEELRTELADLLGREFVPGLFEVSALRRMGSAPGRDKATGDQRLTVYFNAELRFRKDFDLTAWDGPNAASLAFLLGATEKGLVGIRPGGNREDDRLRVHGSRLYALRQGDWRPLMMVAAMPGKAAKKSEAPQVLSRLDELTERAIKRYGGAEQAIIDKELGASLTRIERQLDQLAKVVSVASGPVGGAYHRYIQVLEDNVKRTGFPVRNHATQGSVENCQLVQQGRVDIAIAQSNVAALALEGKGPFKEVGRLPDIRALSALFPEYLQVVVAKGAEIEDLSALKGRRIDIGLPNSGTRVDTLRLLDALGLRLSDFSEVRESGLEAAAVAIEQGELDAFFTTLQAPNRSLQNLFASRAAHLLPLTGEVQDVMGAKHRNYRKSVVAPHTYPGQLDPIPTLGVTATLIVRADVPDSKVHDILSRLYTSATGLKRHHLGLTLLNKSSAREGVFIPFHSAAERFYSGTETGVSE
jgi:TRAP transporter TAXI family solute receptor